MADGPEYEPTGNSAPAKKVPAKKAPANKAVAKKAPAKKAPTMGTWGYLAPERFTTGAADASGDIYALACVMYQCLIGVQPFPGESMPQQVHGL